jgi:Peptidase family C25
MEQSVDEGMPIPFGISARTGKPVKGLSGDIFQQLVEDKQGQQGVLNALKEKEKSEKSFALIGGVKPDDLKQAGWGVLFAANVGQEVKEALQPLLEHRSKQIEGGTGPFKVFSDGEEGYRPGESAKSWLKRQGKRNIRLDVVDPTQGVPYYLLIVGSPEAIPFEFQYTLDIYWAVGRLWFENPDEFRQYANSVIKYEKEFAPISKRLAIFATQHDYDRATQLFTAQVAAPLAGALEANGDFEVLKLFGQQASKCELTKLLRGDLGGGTPAILFSGTHGMEFDAEHPLQKSCQGALVCQDWNNSGPIDAKAWFSGEDIPLDANVLGLVHFLFACHGAGCPTLDNFDRLNKTPRRIAEQAILSRFPQKLLSHPNGGALAVIGHVERAWAFSFQSDRGTSQTQGFRDVILRLMQGERIGHATDAFNSRWAALSTELAEVLQEIQDPSQASRIDLANLWIARDDARNYIIVGDPAVQLRVK